MRAPSLRQGRHFPPLGCRQYSGLRLVETLGLMCLDVVFRNSSLGDSQVAGRELWLMLAEDPWADSVAPSEGRCPGLGAKPAITLPRIIAAQESIAVWAGSSPVKHYSDGR